MTRKESAIWLSILATACIVVVMLQIIEAVTR